MRSEAGKAEGGPWQLGALQRVEALVNSELANPWNADTERFAQKIACALTDRLAGGIEAAIAELQSRGYLVIPAPEEGEVVDDSDQKP